MDTLNAKPTVGAMSAVSSLLDSVIDYAGLFPPAKLSMPDAVRAFADYVHGPHSALLGRFVCPIARLPEFETAFAELPANRRLSPKWELSVLAGADPASDGKLIAAFNARHTAARVVSLETKASTPEEISRATAGLPDSLEVWVEFSPLGDITKFANAIKSAGRGAKIRTGGVTPDAFPNSQDVVRFFRACHQASVVAKATAGLHHPVRGTYRLTYDAGAPSGTMFGFLNVFLAAALIHTKGSDADALALLEERDARKFKVQHDEVLWRSRKFTADQLAATRRELCRSFGSCSFTEPVEGLEAMRWL